MIRLGVSNQKRYKMFGCEHEIEDYGDIYMCILCQTIIIIVGMILSEDDIQIGNRLLF